MKESKHSNVSVQISGDQMSEADVGRVATINAWRELARDIGNLVIKALWIGIATWHGGVTLSNAALSYLGSL